MKDKVSESVFKNIFCWLYVLVVMFYCIGIESLKEANYCIVLYVVVEILNKNATVWYLETWRRKKQDLDPYS
jgi:hypothetical protein